MHFSAFPVIRKWVVLAVLSIPFHSWAQQRLQLNLFGGFANYQGDLQGKPFTLEQSNAAFGAGLSYAVTNHFLLRAGLASGKIKASDKYNKPSLQVRNLDFETRITEASAMIEYDLMNMAERKFSPYIFAGLAVFHFNPYTIDSSGYKVMLQPLGTEGQGLAQYPARKAYRLTQMAIPIGGGLKLRLSDNVLIAYEVGLRKLSTDYLDDVSANYVDKTALLAAKGAKAVELAYRGDEVKNGPPDYPADGTRRGSPKLKDWYYFHGISLNIGLNAGNGGRKSRFGCPGRVM